MIAFFISGERKWFIRGPEIPEFIWPVTSLHEKTKAYQLIKGGPIGASPEEVYADYWITHTNSKDYHICEDSIRVGTDAILTLLWWKNEQQLLDLDEDSKDSEEWDPPHF
jgi:hypothetical protein